MKFVRSSNDGTGRGRLRSWVCCGLGLLWGYILGQRQIYCFSEGQLLLDNPSLLRQETTTTENLTALTASSQHPPLPLSWWEPIVQANQAKPDGLRVYESPIPFTHRKNDHRLIQLLKIFGKDPSQRTTTSNDNSNNNSPGTIVDIGLPRESIVFGNAGYNVQSFEARQSGYDQVAAELSKHGLLQQQQQQQQQRVQLHHMALSNYTGTTEIFDANDSSSLIKQAVVNGEHEARKFARNGGRSETVPVTTLDRHFASLASSTTAATTTTSITATSVVGIKVDTQGVEPEIFFGAQTILANPPDSRPRVIVTEYCTYLRPFDELSMGIHLLIGLGYTCYYPQGKGMGTSMVVTPESEYCGDFYCTHEPLQAKIATTN